MAHFLDEYPLRFGDVATRELHRVLVSRFYDRERIVQFLRTTPLDPGEVDLNGSARSIWFSALNVARDHDLLRAVVDKAKDEPALTERLQELLADAPVVEAPGALGTADEPADRDWAGPLDARGIERATAGATTLLDVSFLAGGLAVAPAVARLLVTFDRGRFHGTAFRVGPELLLTNHHVLYDWKNADQRATKVSIWLDYEIELGGATRDIVAKVGDVAGILGVKQNDWAVVRCADLPDSMTTLSLVPSKPTEVEDRVYIIQHPGGGPKKIGMHHNTVSLVDGDVVQYLTDTEQGSSGAPVFNDRWEVVALHHRWVEVRDDERVAYRNQGRTIQRVREELTAAGVAAGG